MPNPIKYSTNAQTLALKKGNYWIGTGDVPKDPTSTTDYWNGITPPSNGYTIYQNKASNGPSVYVASNDSQLISFTNHIAGTSYTTVNECFNYFNGQSDKMVFNRDMEPILTNGLRTYYDAGFLPSYPRNGTTLNGLSGSGGNGILINGPTFDSGNGGSILLDGINDYITGTTVLSSSVNYSYSFWVNIVSLIPGGNPDSNGNLLRVIFNPSNPNNEDDGLVITNGKRLRWYVGGYNVQGQTAENVWTTGQWYQIVLTYNRVAVPRLINLYVNTTKYEFSFSSNIQNISTPYTFNLGIGETRFFNNYLNMKVAIFTFYDKVLSDAEVLQNYNAQKARFGL